MSLSSEQNSPDQPIILVIDDSPQNIRAVGDVLSSANFEVISAGSGAHAWERIRAQLPDLILLDLGADYVNAIETCLQLKVDPRTNKIPVIFITSNNEPENLAQVFRAGAGDYVTKPIRAEELLARVRTHLEIAKARHALRNYTQRLRELNEEKNEFLGIVAHDLRSPLANIVTSTNMIIEDPQMDRVQLAEFLRMIQSSGVHMIHLVENLMDVNAIEQGRMRMDLVPCEIGELLRGIANAYRSQTKAKKQNLSITEEDAPLIAMADAHSTIQVFDNLVSNAIKYSPAGKPIQVRLRRRNGVIRCEVADEGPGLTADDLSKVFEKFGRLSAKPTAGEPSTGLGLSIVKRMVEAGGGKVWCESEPGRGARFIVELPAAPAVEAETGL